MTTSITHHQMRMLLLRATSLILRAIYLAAGAILMMISGVLKQKLIELVLVRTIGALIKDAPTIIEIGRFIFERIGIIRSLDYSILDSLVGNHQIPESQWDTHQLLALRFRFS